MIGMDNLWTILRHLFSTSELYLVLPYEEQSYKRHEKYFLRFNRVIHPTGLLCLQRYAKGKF